MFKLKKSLGQNFLIDKNIISKIINLINIKNKNIVEIGPGKGALTNKILEKNPKTLTLIEKDNKLLDELKIKYKNQKLINYYNEDILKIDLQKLINKNSIIFGNLPYNVSSQILVKLIKFKKWPPLYTDLVLMFQKEVAEKIVGKSYGRLSIIANLRLNIKKKFDVSANCFFPKPKVISTVLHFTPIKKINYKIKNINNLEYITNILFSNKRKMINKNIKKLFNKEEIKKINNINLNYRPSEIEPNIYYKMVKIYESRK